MVCCGKGAPMYKKVISEKREVVSSYVEGSEGYTKVQYLGVEKIKVVGCKTNKFYLFEQGVERLIDTGDADCIFDVMPGQFEAIIEVDDVSI